MSAGLSPLDVRDSKVSSLSATTVPQLKQRTGIIKDKYQQPICTIFVFFFVHLDHQISLIRFDENLQKEDVYRIQKFES